MGFQWISTTNLNWRFQPSTVGVDKVECVSRYVRLYPLLKDMEEKPRNVFFVGELWMTLMGLACLEFFSQMICWMQPSEAQHF